MKTRTLFLFLVSLFLFQSYRSLSQDSDGSGKQSFSFFNQNKGQLNHPEFKYFLSKGDANVFFGERSVIYQLLQMPSRKYLMYANEILFPENEKVHVQNIRLNFPGSAVGVTIVPLDKQDSYTNYFIGNDKSGWAPNVENYGGLIYKNLFEGVDMKYYKTSGNIKYDFIVNPGGNIGSIRMGYEGIEGVSLDSQGHLVIHCKKGDISENIPEAYQLIQGSKVKVNVFYCLQGSGVVAFKCDSYNKNFPLVIDPALIYSTYVGGSGDDQIFCGEIQRDRQNNVYTIGWSSGANFPVTPGAYDVTYNGGNYDGFILKLNPTGSALVYCTYIGGNAFDNIRSLFLDTATNNVYFTGQTQSSNFPTTAGAFQSSWAGVSDIFVGKLNALGSSLLFCTLIGGPGDDIPMDLKADASGNTYISGQSQNGQFPVTAGVYQSTNNGGWDNVTFKLNPTGTALGFSTYSGGGANDRGCGIDLDPSGNIYICGFTDGAAYPTTTGAFSNTYRGAWDGYVTKFNPSGTAMIYSTYLSGPGNDWMRTASLRVDGAGMAYVNGITEAGFPVTPGAYQTVCAGNSDAFVTKLNATGTGLLYSTFIGSPGNDGGFGMYLNKSSGEVSLTGYCEAGFPTTPCAYNRTYNGNTDAFFLRLNAAGSNLLYSTYIGGSQYDLGGGVVCNIDTAYIVGQTKSLNFPVTSSAFQQNYGGGTNDVFLLKLSLNGNTPPSFTSANPVCQNSVVTFSNTSSGISYSWKFGNGQTSTSVNPSVVYATSGTFTVTLISTGTCGVDSIKQTVSVLALPAVTVIGNHTVCSGQSVTIQASGASTYSWSPASTLNVSNTATVIASPSTNITYTVVGTSASGCKDTSLFSLTINPAPLVSVTPVDSVCKGTSATLTATGASTYSWSPSATLNISSGPTVSSNTLVTTIYTVTGTGVNGCTASATSEVYVSALPVILTSGLDTLCSGSTTVLAVSGASTYTWTPSTYLSSTSGSSVSCTPAANITYTITGVNGLGCFGTTLWNLVVGNASRALFSMSEGCTGNVVFTQSSQNASAFHWSFGDGQTSALAIPVHNFASAGIYTVMLTTDPGTICKDSVQHIINVHSGSPAFSIPNIFSPNEDGQNDVFALEGLDYCTDFSIQIYDRWGVLLFHTDQAKQNFWNGRDLSGQPVVAGVYFYILTGDKGYVKTGPVTLIR
ncbi:MAG: PKD domain-containing protein [Bacteroidia bacterium]